MIRATHHGLNAPTFTRRSDGYGIGARLDVDFVEVVASAVGSGRFEMLMVDGSM